MAAYNILQRTMELGNIGPKQTKGPPETGGPDVSQKNAIAYSAATLRGGSSAPESWISAT
jgi:hypothetical protein